MVAAVFITHETNEMFDNALREVAHTIIALDGQERGSVLDSDTIERIVLAGDRKSYMSFQVRDSGQVIRRSSTAPPEIYPAALQPGYAWHGSTRYYTRRMPSGAFVQVAEYFDERRDALVGLLAGLAVPLLVLMGLSALLISRSAEKVGKPIAALGEAFRARSGANLEPLLDEGSPIELRPIVDEANALLARVKRTIEAERDFSANCAHELRNPIAAARAQVEFLLRFPDDASSAHRLGQIEDSLRRLGSRIERLLQLSRSEAGVGRSGSCNLVAVTQLLVDDYAMRGEAVDLRINGQSEVLVDVDPDAAGIAIQNLIDNALANAAPHTRIAVTVDDAGALRVVNDCPAVSQAELIRLGKRFQSRRNGKTNGYGLGLSIVGELMRHSGGVLELKSPATGRAAGFEAIMQLPRQLPQSQLERRQENYSKITETAEK